MNAKDEFDTMFRDIANRERKSIADNSFSPRILWYDDEDQPPRLIMMPTVDGTTHGQIAWALKVLTAVQNDVSKIVFIMDSWHTRTPTKKNGEPWGQGGMEYAVVNKTEDAENVYEGFNVQVTYADGSHAMGVVPYLRVNGEVEYQWDSDSAYQMVGNDTGASVAGFFPDAMAEAVAVPKMTKAMDDMFGVSGSDFGLEPWRTALHTLSVGVKMVIQDTHFPCLVVARNEDEAELLEHSMTEGPFSEGIASWNGQQLEEIAHLEEIYAMNDNVPDSAHRRRNL